MKLNGSQQILNAVELIKVESHPTFIKPFAILTCTVRVVVDRTPFIAEVNFGNYRWRAWHPHNVWVRVEPDKKHKDVKARMRRATVQARLRGFKSSPTNLFIHACLKCAKLSVTAKFREALLLPHGAEIDLAATVQLAKRWSKAKMVGDVCVIPLETYSLCLLHGPSIRYEEEPFN